MSNHNALFKSSVITQTLKYLAVVLMFWYLIWALGECDVLAGDEWRLVAKRNSETASLWQKEV